MAQRLTVRLMAGVVEVDSIEAAAKAVRAEIRARDVGASEWYRPGRGVVKGARGALVARISYNGRIWDTDGAEIVPEPAQ
jgi:hypothetical protein